MVLSSDETKHYSSNQGWPVKKADKEFFTIYGFEEKIFSDHANNSHLKKYRWYSKYNGSRGPWCATKEEAKSGGEEHQKIILSIHGIHLLKNENKLEL